MPFTFSHPLYAVPLHRAAPKWISITGLAAWKHGAGPRIFCSHGVLSNDWPYFNGFILLGLPLSIALAFAFHLVLKPVLSKFMPSAGGLDHFVQSLPGGNGRFIRSDPGSYFSLRFFLVISRISLWMAGRIPQVYLCMCFHC